MDGRGLTGFASDYEQTTGQISVFDGCRFEPTLNSSDDRRWPQWGFDECTSVEPKRAWQPRGSSRASVLTAEDRAAMKELVRERKAGRAARTATVQCAPRSPRYRNRTARAAPRCRHGERAVPFAEDLVRMQAHAGRQPHRLFGAVTVGQDQAHSDWSTGRRSAAGHISLSGVVLSGLHVSGARADRWRDRSAVLGRRRVRGRAHQ